jgi:(p)ppGpp synthase/HD superfamily hydrolase
MDLKKRALETIFNLRTFQKLSTVANPSARQRNLVALILLEVLASLPHCAYSVKWLKERQHYWSAIGDTYGFWQLRYQLEDALFAVMKPQEYALVVSLLEKQNRMHARLFAGIESILERSLRERGIHHVEIMKRKKNLYGIYQKMQLKGKNINHITDLFGFRIITDSVGDCYRVLSVLHHLWRPFTDRLKDYIASPKPSGYCSIHTTVLCLEQAVVEFQIRTREMDRYAKFGPASHCRYRASRRSID